MLDWFWSLFRKKPWKDERVCGKTVHPEGSYKKEIDLSAAICERHGVLRIDNALHFACLGWLSETTGVSVETLLERAEASANVVVVELPETTILQFRLSRLGYNRIEGRPAFENLRLCWLPGCSGKEVLFFKADSSASWQSHVKIHREEVAKYQASLKERCNA